MLSSKFSLRLSISSLFLIISLIAPLKRSDADGPELVARWCPYSCISGDWSWSTGGWGDGGSQTYTGGGSGTQSYSGAVTESSMSVSASAQLSGLMDIGAGNQAVREASQKVALYVKGSPSVKVNYSSAGEVRTNYGSLRGMGASANYPGGDESVSRPYDLNASPGPQEISQSIGSSGSTFTAGSCSGGSFTIPGYTGVQYSVLDLDWPANGAGASVATGASAGTLDVALSASVTTSYQVEIGSEAPEAVLTGPLNTCIRPSSPLLDGAVPSIRQYCREFFSAC